MIVQGILYLLLMCLLRSSNVYLCCTLQQTVARLVIVDEDLKTLLVGFEGNVLLNIFGHNWLY